MHLPEYQHESLLPIDEHPTVPVTIVPKHVTIFPNLARKPGYLVEVHICGGVPRRKFVQLIRIETGDRRTCVKSALQWAAIMFPERFTKRIVRLRRDYEAPEVTLLRLGARYERLMLDWAEGERDDEGEWDAIKLTEELIQAYCAHLIARDDGIPERYVVRGRNVIRRARGLEEVNV